MTLKFGVAFVDISNIDKEVFMVQWVTVVLALLGFAYNGYKDYASGNLKSLTNQQDSVKSNYPIQYCLMAYDPNIDKIFYQHETGQWYDYPPQQRRYATPSQPYQNQGATAVAGSHGTQGTPSYRYGQSPQANANPIR